VIEANVPQVDKFSIKMDLLEAVNYEVLELSTET
jgi:hypothetical protein